MPKLKTKWEKRLQKIALSVAGHAARGLGEGSRSSRRTAVVEQQLTSETVQHVTDESGSEYFPTPKKGRKIVELLKAAKKSIKYPRIACFYRDSAIALPSHVCQLLSDTTIGEITHLL